MDATKKEREMLRWVQEDVLMSALQQEDYLKTHGRDGWLLAAEDRAFPLHDRFFLPARWLSCAGSPCALAGEARPGECYAFQLALYAPEGLNGVRLTGRGFCGELTCINAGGCDCLGRPFSRLVSAEPGRVQPLWFYLLLPDGFRGEICGEIEAAPEGKPSKTAKIYLKVQGEPLPRHGDDEPWRQSRLRWLNSTIAQDDGITRPFIPLSREGQAIRSLGHRVFLGPNGLPNRIESFLDKSVTSISRTPRPVLAAPFSFTLQMPQEHSGSETPLSFTKENAGIVCWQAQRQMGAVDICTEAAMEYDGYQEYRITLFAREETPLQDVRLTIPFHPEAARYWMGLGEQGGFRKKELDWKWDTSLNQDTLWMGDVNAGLMLRLHDRYYEKPYMLIYYHYHPLVLPEGWGNGGLGGVRVREEEGRVILEAYSGPRLLHKGESLSFDFDLALTPAKPIDLAEHWHDRYYHDLPASLGEVSASGANIINIHHGKALNPFINTPYFETEALAQYVQECHKRGIRVKIYDTVKEISVRTPEFWALRSLGDEVIPHSYETGSSFQGSIPEADGWLQRYLGENYLTAWRQMVNDGPYQDEPEISVVAAPMSRLNNFFLEGLRWLLEQTGIDGLYFDDTAFTRSIMKRIRKLLDRSHPRCSLDLHSWNYYKDNTVDDSRLAGWGNSMNLYIDQISFLDRLWFGEGFNYDVPPDSWLIEMSGIPFGIMAEMLQDGGNIWRGMVYGMANRMPNPKNPSGLWALWDRFRMADAVPIGWWDPDCPIKTGHPQVKATLYRQAHQCLLALASWSPREERVALAIDYEALGLDREKARLSIPEIPGFQQALPYQKGEELLVPAGQGFILLLDEQTKG